MSVYESLCLLIIDSYSILLDVSGPQAPAPFLDMFDEDPTTQDVREMC